MSRLDDIAAQLGEGLADAAFQFTSMAFRLGSTHVNPEHFSRASERPRHIETSDAKKPTPRLDVERYILFLKFLRLRASLSQQEMADKLKTRQSAISRFENGLSNPTLGFLRRYLKVLGAELELVIKNARN